MVTTLIWQRKKLKEAEVKLADANRKLQTVREAVKVLEEASRRTVAP